MNNQGNGASELDKAIANFGETLRGPIIGRQHPEYEDTRKLYNGMIDKRPLVIARCVDIADVIAADKLRSRQWSPHRHPRRRPQRTWIGELQ